MDLQHNRARAREHVLRKRSPWLTIDLPNSPYGSLIAPTRNLFFVVTQPNQGAPAARNVVCSTFERERMKFIRTGSLRQIASELGGILEEPHLSWKDDRIVKRFGWSLRRKAEIQMPKLRQAFVIAWNKAMFQLEKRYWASYRAT
jgi:hypothetical protein